MSTPTTDRTPAQQRVIDAALLLFAEHGVSGTSLQDIADALGVTKAAVYHQFPSKQEIVLSAIETPLREIAAILDLAGQADSPTSRVEVLIDALVDLVVSHRRTIAPLQNDPAMGEIISNHPPYADLPERLLAAASVDPEDPGDRVTAVMVINAVVATSGSAILADVDDDTLGAHLRAGARRLATR